MKNKHKYYNFLLSVLNQIYWILDLGRERRVRLWVFLDGLLIRKEFVARWGSNGSGKRREVADERDCDDSEKHRDVAGEQVTVSVFKNTGIFMVKRKGEKEKQFVGSVTPTVVVAQIGRDVNTTKLDLVVMVMLLSVTREVAELVAELRLGDGDVHTVELTSQRVNLNLISNSNLIFEFVMFCNGWDVTRVM